jgi:hypothetical protein
MVDQNCTVQANRSGDEGGGNMSIKWAKCLDILTLVSLVIPASYTVKVKIMA